MRILFLCNSHVWGGAEKYVVDIARGLAGRGHDCRIAAPQATPLFDAALAQRTPVLPLDIGPKLGRRTAHESARNWRRHRATIDDFLGRCIEQHGIQAVHVQFKKEQLLATAAAARRGVPVLWTEHDRLPSAFARLPFAMTMYRRAAALTGRIVCVSGFVVENLAGHGVRRERLELCYNGIAVGRTDIAGDRHDRALVRSRFGIGPDDVVVGTTSRLMRIKGHRDLLAATPALLARFPDLRLLIAGDGPARRKLERQARRLGIGERVHFTGHTHDVRPLLAAMDIFAAPSRSEGMPFSVLEAMAARLPVVGTRVGGIPEALGAGSAGSLVHAGDIGGLTAALAPLLGDEGLRRHLGSAGHERVLSLFTTQRMIEGTETAFRAVVEPIRAIGTAAQDTPPRRAAS